MHLKNKECTDKHSTAIHTPCNNAVEQEQHHCLQLQYKCTNFRKISIETLRSWVCNTKIWTHADTLCGYVAATIKQTGGTRRHTHVATTVMLEYQHKARRKARVYTHARRYTLADRVQVPVPLQRCACNVVWRRELFVFQFIPLLLLLIIIYLSVLCTFAPILLLPPLPQQGEGRPRRLEGREGATQTEASYPSDTQ